MNLRNKVIGFLKIFKTKSSEKFEAKNKYDGEYLNGFDAYKSGKKLFKESILSKDLDIERQKQKITEALKFFDQAIEKGYNEPDVQKLRGLCIDFYYQVLMP